MLNVIYTTDQGKVFVFTHTTPYIHPQVFLTKMLSERVRKHLSNKSTSTKNQSQARHLSNGLNEQRADHHACTLVPIYHQNEKEVDFFSRTLQTTTSRCSERATALQSIPLLRHYMLIVSGNLNQVPINAASLARSEGGRCRAFNVITP